MLVIPASRANTITGVPTAPNVVATLLDIRLATAENNGLNPRLINIAAGIATAVPNPAIPSSNPPNPQVSSKTCTHLSDETEVNCDLIISMFLVQWFVIKKILLSGNFAPIPKLSNDIFIFLCVRVNAEPFNKCF
jgi:hypothetical protein